VAAAPHLCLLLALFLFASLLHEDATGVVEGVGLDALPQLAGEAGLLDDQARWERAVLCSLSRACDRYPARTRGGGRSAGRHDVRCSSAHEPKVTADFISNPDQAVLWRMIRTGSTLELLPTEKEESHDAPVTATVSHRTPVRQTRVANI